VFTEIFELFLEEKACLRRRSHRGKEKLERKREVLGVRKGVEDKEVQGIPNWVKGLRAFDIFGRVPFGV